MEALHNKVLFQMREEHARKKLDDEKKFEDLKEQKEVANMKFEENIQEIKMAQDELIIKMDNEHNDALEKARERVAMLREEEK